MLWRRKEILGCLDERCVRTRRLRNIREHLWPKKHAGRVIGEIRQFKQQSVLWVCAVIVTGMQLWNRLDLQPPRVYAQLLSLYFDRDIRNRLIVGYRSSSPRRVLFHRRQVLLIARLAIAHCPGQGIDARENSTRLGSIWLKANDQFDYGLLPAIANPRPACREDYARIIAEMIAVGEHGSPNIAHLITRRHLMLTRFSEEVRENPDFVDVAGEHLRVSGLTIEEFEALILGFTPDSEKIWFESWKPNRAYCL